MTFGSKARTWLLFGTAATFAAGGTAQSDESAIDVNKILERRELIEVIAESEKGGKTDIPSLLFRLNLYSRSANGPKMAATIGQIVDASKPDQSSQVLSRVTPYAKDPLVSDSRVLHRFLSSYFSDEVFGRLFAICAADRSSCDTDAIDNWLGREAEEEPAVDSDIYMNQGGRWTWIMRRINWRKQFGGDVSGITAGFADAVRNDPGNLNAALRFIRVAQNAQELQWLAETFSSNRAYDYFELGSRLSRLSDGVCCPELRVRDDRMLINLEGAKLLRRSLDLPFTENDIRLMGTYRLSGASVAPQIGNFEKQLRYWTKKELAAAYVKIERPQEAQPLVEELARIDMSDILADSTARIAGASQLGSGARVVESKILAEQAAKQDTQRYWLERIEYYRGRKEPVQVFDAYLQGLRLVPVDFSNEASVHGRMWLVKSFAEFATDSHFGMDSRGLSNLDETRSQFRKGAEAFFAEEFERTKKHPNYASELLGVIDEEGFDELSEKLLPEYPAIILGSIPSEVAIKYFESETIEQSKKDALFAQLLQAAGKMKIQGAWSYCSSLLDLGQVHQNPRVIGILTKNFHAVKGRTGSLGDGVTWNNIKERYAEVLFDAYIRANDWQSAERVYSENVGSWMDSPFERMALAAARSGSVDNAMRFWKIRANLNRRSLDFLHSYRKYPQFAERLRVYYRQMKLDEPYSPVPDLALKALN